MGRAGILSRVGALAAAALVGGAVALGGAALFGRLGSHTTIQQISPLPGGGLNNVALSTQSSSGGLTSAQIYKRDAPGVVQITATTKTTVQDPFGFGQQTSTSEALGSGFVVDKAGHIVTNYHVIAGAQKVQVSFSGQDEIRATVVGKDPSTDIAVLKIDAHAAALNPLSLGDSSAVVVGQPVVAIGNPFGLARTLTAGVVSAVQRRIASPNQQSLDDAIQTDAAINHGNSGGPLINALGQVIGVTSQIQTGSSGSDGNVGIGFAIPSNTVRTVVAQLIANGKALHAYLGVQAIAITPQLRHLFNLPTRAGLIIEDVTAGSGADKAGLRAGTTSVVVQGMTYHLGGDIITKVAGQPVATPEQLIDAIARLQPGDHVVLDIYRGGKERNVTATLGNRPEAGP